MKTMNGFTNELAVRRAKRNWRTRCGAFLLAALACWYSGDAMAAVQISTGQGRGLGQNIDFADTPTPPAQAGPNAGGPGGNAHSQYEWNGNPYNDLNLLVAGMSVNTVDTANDDAPGQHVLTTYDNLTFTTGGGEVRVSSDMTWAGNSNFSVDGGVTGTVMTSGAILNLGSRLTVNAGSTLNISTWDNAATYSTGGIIVTGGTNSGTINLNGTELTVNSSAFDGGGTINIGQYGMLNLGSVVFSQNVLGNYSPSYAINRGLVNTAYSGVTDITGHLSGSVGFTGGGDVYVRSNNYNDAGFASLSALYVMNGTNVIFADASNLGSSGTTNDGGTIMLTSEGGLTKANTTADVTLHNSISINSIGGTSSAVGMLNSLTTGTDTSEISWKTNADSFSDAGDRLIVAGGVVSDVKGALLHINNQRNYDAYGTANGTVVLQADNQGYNGHYQVHRGVLEINRQANLGVYDNSVKNTVTIGDVNAPSNRAVLRVVGTGGNLATPERIQDRVVLDSQSAFYEVFTTGGDAATPDANRFAVLQTGQISGRGSLNKTGDGILILGDAGNAYTGDTNIWHGVLQISNAGNINNNANAKLRIGGDVEMESGNFRPVFETKLDNNATGTLVVNAQVLINEKTSTVRTTGEGNVTKFTNSITTGVAGEAASYDAVFNKDGAGTLVLDGDGNWGRNGNGELWIHQGTVEISKSTNLTAGDVVIGDDWNTYKDIESFGAGNTPILYKAVLKTADNSTVALGNRIVLNSPAPGAADDPAAGSYIETGTNSVLTVGAITEDVAGSNLNKTGSGKLVLNSINNTFGGWANVYDGTLSTAAAQNLGAAKGVDLIGAGTVFDMSTKGADQTLNGLRGGTDAAGTPEAAGTEPEDWTRKVLIGDNTLTLNINNFKADDVNNRTEFRGNIVGTGTVVKSGLDGSTFASGFVGFNGGFNVQSGTLELLSDTTITGIAGRAGSYLDVKDNEVVIDINANQEYKGTIISSYPSFPYGTTAVRPHIIKDGAGILTAGFYDRNVASEQVRSYQGDLTILSGGIVSTTDFAMEGGGKLTFGINESTIGTPILLDVSGHSALFRPSEDGLMTSVSASIADAAAAWNTAPGSANTILAKILGNNYSDYSGLTASDTDSLFYGLDLVSDAGPTWSNMLVKLRVSGFEGVGDTFNTRAVGKHLDAARVTDVPVELGKVLQDIWSYGSNISDNSVEAKQSQTPLPTREEREAAVQGLFQQLSGDTIANGMFMGLDKPWRQAFDRLNLDSQMICVNPQGHGGQKIVNMRNLWFTPTYQGIQGRSDGNARRFGIDRPGYKLGFDKRVAQNTSVGFMLGYSTPKLHQGDDRIDASDFQFGLYGGTMVGNYIEMKGYIGFGHQNFKSNRNVYYDFSPLSSYGTYVAHGRYDGDTFNFSFEIARPLFLGFAILRPTIGLDSEHAFRYAFTETGSAIAMKYQRSSLSRTRARFGLSLETTTLDRAIFTGRLGYSCLLGGHDYADATGTLVGTNVPAMTVHSVAVGKSYFEAGVGTRIFLNPVKTLALVGNYDATVGDRWAENQGSVGFTYIY